MTCIQAQAMITPFINNKLSIKELEEFLAHVHSCGGCREELEVYYALLTAMKQLDEDKNLSGRFSEELAEKLEKSHEKVIHAKYTYYRKKVMLLLTMILLAILISLGYANRSMKEESNPLESHFYIRRLYRQPGNEMIDQMLQQYQREQGKKETGQESQQIPLP